MILKEYEANGILEKYGISTQGNLPAESAADVGAAACLASGMNLIAIETDGRLAQTHGEIKRG